MDNSRIPDLLQLYQNDVNKTLYGIEKFVKEVLNGIDLEQAAKMASQAKPSLEKSLACFASQAVLCAKSQIGKLKPSQALEKACLEKMASSSHEIGKPSQAASFFPFKNKANFKRFRALFEPYN